VAHRGGGGEEVAGGLDLAELLVVVGGGEDGAPSVGAELRLEALGATCSSVTLASSPAIFFTLAGVATWMS